MTDPHPSANLDEAVHQRVRPGVLAILAEVKEADFACLRDALEVTDSNLSRHLQTLEQGGYVAIDKHFADRKPRTWASATTRGRAALQRELDALQAKLDRLDAAPR